MTVDRVVVGGGFSGLLDAYEALGRGESVVVVEASSELGGVIQPVTVGGITIDAGAEAFSTVDDHVIDLAERIGLGSDIISPSGLPARVIGPDATTVIPEGIFGIPRDLDDPVLVAAVGPEAVAIAKEKDRGPLPSVWTSLSVGEMVRQRLGEKFATHLTEPVIAGVHGVGADDLDANLVFPQVVKEAMACGSLVEAVNRVRGNRPSPGLAVATISGGLFRMTKRLAELIQNMGGEIITGTRVMSLAQSREGWGIQTSNQPLTARTVTLASGPSAQVDLLRSAFRKQVSPPGATTDSSVVFATVTSEQLSVFPLGTGALVSSDRHLSIRATTHLNAKWHYLQEALPTHTHVIRFSMRQTQAGIASDIAESGLTELYQVSDASITDSVRVSWPGSLVTPHRGHSGWVHDHAPAWESAGITLRGALISGNGLLGITHSTQKKDAA
jgi:protoporphyrinogen/coproporphyrinogen III oxidase